MGQADPLDWRRSMDGLNGPHCGNGKSSRSTSAASRCAAPQALH